MLMYNIQLWAKGGRKLRVWHGVTKKGMYRAFNESHLYEPSWAYWNVYERTKQNKRGGFLGRVYRDRLSTLQAVLKK